MYKYSLLILLLVSSLSVLGQVGIGTQTPSPSAMLDVKSSQDNGATYRGLMPPRVPSIVERDLINAIDSDVGLLVFIVDISCFQIWNGVSWESINCGVPPTLNSVVAFSTTIPPQDEDAGGIDLEFTITDPSPTNSISITVAADDYNDIDETGPQVLVIPANVTNYTAIGVFNITDDVIVEPQETISLTLTAISGGQGTASIGGFNSNNLLINDNDVPGTIVEFASTLPPHDEDAGGVDFEFNITNPSPTDAVVLKIEADSYSDIDENTFQIVSIPANTLTFTASSLFTITDDTDDEPNETVTIKITEISGGQGVPQIGTFNTNTLLIIDNDPTPFIPFVESFETDGNGTRYTLSAPEGADLTVPDYFIRTDGTEIIYTGANRIVEFFGNPDGNYFFAAQDIGSVTEITDGPNQFMNFTGIPITNGVNLQFDILIAEDDSNNGGSPEHWDANNDRLRISYSIDGMNYQRLLAVESELANGQNGKPRIDTDFDNVGDGQEITSTWTNFSASIPQTGDVLDLRINFRLNANGEDIAIDFIRITSN